MQKWEIFVKEIKHEVVFKGFKLSGKAEISVDDNHSLYSAVVVKDLGDFYLFEVDGSEILLKFSTTNNILELIQDGIYLDSGLPIEEKVVTTFRSIRQANDPHLQKNQDGMSSFLSFVIFTYVNLFLIILNSPFSFPFSAVIPQYIVGMVMYFNESTPSAPILIGGIIIALIFASAYLMLYFLGKKRTWAIITALILISIDTLVVLYFAINDFAYYVIDIVFHAWVIWTFIKLVIVRKNKI